MIRRQTTWFPVLIVLLCIVFVADLLLGSVDIPLRDAIKILLGGESDVRAWNHIMHHIRIPKAITATLAGAALSVSGLQMQTLFRNPLASPSELGISAGAALGTGFLIMVAGQTQIDLSQLQRLGIGSSWLLVFSASVGAAFVFSLLLLVARFVRDNVVLLIVGLLLGTLTLSITTVWQYYSQPENLQAFIAWTFGNIGGVSGPQLTILALISTAGLVFSFTLSKKLNAFLLGENYAASMGVTVPRMRLLILINTCLLTGTVTAFCGPIGFVGIAVPHLTRALMGTSNHLLLIPACSLTGSILLLGCDIFAQLPGSEMVLPINIATSMIGAPIVIWIILKMHNLRTSF